MVKPAMPSNDHPSFLYFMIIALMTLIVPVLVLPAHVDNAFNTPKNLIMILGISIMTAVLCIYFLRGKKIPWVSSPSHKILLFIILLNVFSFFYTKNHYFTIVAATLNITCLSLFFFTSLHINGKRAFWLLVIAAFSGFLVTIVTYLQFTGHFILFKWAYPGIMVMGTIGNSNYLGAYYIFPLFAVLGLVFLLDGEARIIPATLFIFMLGGFLFTRARAGWMGFFLSLPLFLLFLSKIHRFSVLDFLRLHPRRVITGLVVLAIILLSLWHLAPERFHVMMGLKNITRSDTLRLRMEKYYRASFWLFEQNPLFGTGLWSFRSQVYRAQAEINKIDPEFFKDYPEPKPRRVHTDYLEILNDGGLLAASALLLFFLSVMRHGWYLIRDENIGVRERIIAATAFCSLISIMLAAFFFFPFRINSTLFMTALMMGILEGLYLAAAGGGIKSLQLNGKRTGKILLPLVIILLAGFVWFTAIKPFIGEVEHFKYKKALARGDAKGAERFILKALEYDPHNTAYCLYASQLYMNVLKDFGKARDFIERAIIDFNGDITMWSAYFIKGLLKLQMGSLYEAQAAFEKALYFNPTFQPARQKLAEVKQIIKDHDRVLIKFR